VGVIVVLRRQGVCVTGNVVTIVVPAYNEVGRIQSTLAEMAGYFAGKPYDFEIIVAADGDDGTREAVQAFAQREPRVRVIGNKERRGKGRGVRHGVELAAGDIIGFVDADNKTPITEFDKFEPLLAEGADVVIGSRRLSQSVIEQAQRWHRRVGSRLFAFVMHALIGLRDIPDTQCGFKFFSRAAARDVFSRQHIDGYMFDVEILDLAVRRGYRLVQVPVRWHDDGDTRLRLLSSNARNMVDILRIRFRRGRPVGAAVR
jgi:dolichyl-phosphate beta-glucosyltransferase